MSDDDLKKQLEEIKNQITQVRIDVIEAKTANLKIHLQDEKFRGDELRRNIADYRLSELRNARSDFAIYFSIFLSAVIGVLGNWYVNLLFQPPSEAVTFSLFFASILLIGALSYLGIMMYSANKEFKKKLPPIAEALKLLREKDKTKADNSF